MDNLPQKSSVHIQRIPWHRSLGFRALLGTLVLGCVLVIGITEIIRRKGEFLVVRESKERIYEAGKNVVTSLEARQREIQALARTLATSLSILPKDEGSYLKSLPSIIDFQGDLAVAGGGVWPEPFAFDKNREKRSFFWGRSRGGALAYIDDYNTSAAGYHKEEWYVPAKFSPPNRCFWSRSYTDPYSFEPMTTCTISVFEHKAFFGNVTIDVKLEGLSQLAREWRGKGIGEVFILDRNNRFLTYPHPDLAKKTGKDQSGNHTEEFITITDFSQKNGSYNPLAQKLEDINHMLIQDASVNDNSEITQAIEKSSNDIKKDEAQLIATMLKSESSKLIEPSEVVFFENVLLKTETLATIFHVPHSFWKVVILTPTSEITEVSRTLTRTLISYFTAAILIITTLGYLLLRFRILKPLTKTTAEIANTQHTLAPNVELDSHLQAKGFNEITLLRATFARLAKALTMSQKNLQVQTDELSALNHTLTQERNKVLHSAKLATLGELAASTAHEINNALSIITTGTSTLPAMIEHPEKLAHRIKMIDKAVDRIARITGNIKKYSRVTSHDPFDYFTLRTSIEEALSITEVKAKKVDATISIECDPSVRLFGNVLEVEQVLVNLVSNSLDAIATKDERWVKIVCDETGPRPIIQVIDSGKGIPKDIAAHIFDPFYTTKDLSTGTGLGMSIVKSILDRHGASITIVESHPNTCFELVFPRK